MGTRNLTVVVANGETKVAKYCQWDGYPSGQGAIILNFLSKVLRGDRNRIESFKDKVVNNTHFISSDEVNYKWKECGANDSGLVSFDISDEFLKRYPSLHRNTGGSILDIINRSNNVVDLENDENFVKDGLFCEWAYVVDLDQNTLEVYKGVYDDKEAPIIPKNRFTDKDGQVKLLKTFNLINLPSEKEFCRSLGDEE